MKKKRHGRPNCSRQYDHNEQGQSCRDRQQIWKFDDRRNALRNLRQDQNCQSEYDRQREAIDQRNGGFLGEPLKNIGGPDISRGEAPVR